MGKIMTNIEFVGILKDIVENFKTVYMLGCFGAPTTEKMIKRAVSRTDVNNHPYEKAALSIKNQGFMFDCVNLIKGILWGWCGDFESTYGGSKYKVNEVPDVGADRMITLCEGVSSDFGDIEVGEAVWMKGHIGVYIGEGKVIEATPKWSITPGVKISWVENLGFQGGQVRYWTKHGKLPWVDYKKQEKIKEVRYHTVKDLPEWSKEAIQFFIDEKLLNGDESGDIDLSIDMVRLLCIFYQGSYKRKE